MKRLWLYLCQRYCEARAARAARQSAYYAALAGKFSSRLRAMA